MALASRFDIGHGAENRRATMTGNELHVHESRSEAMRVIARSMGALALLAAAVLASSCDLGAGSEEPPPDAGLRDLVVRGAATGVLGPVLLELRTRGDTEVLEVTRDGAFVFEARLGAGDSYTVLLVNPDAPCTLRNETGVMAGADVEIELTCTGASLVSLVVSGIAPTIALVPGTADYVVDLPLSQQSITLTATLATPGDRMTIAGQPAASGAPSAEIALNLGDNPVDIAVESALGWQRTYRLILRRAARLAQHAHVTASNVEGGDEFGYSVSLSGDTLAVSAPYEDSAARGVNGDQDDNSAEDSGAVYVFRRAGTVWRQEAYIKAHNTVPLDLLCENSSFGESVALSGDTLVVGAPLEDGGVGRSWNSSAEPLGCLQLVPYEYGDYAGGWNSGAVYVFRRTGTTWQQEAYFKAFDLDEQDWFGASVSLSGDALAVGAPHEDSAAQGVGGNQDDNSAPDSGAVYVFRRMGTSWQQEAYVKASNTGAGDRFGARVSLSGDTLAVGVSGEDSAAQGVDGNQDDNEAADSGAVYVFRRNDMTWQQEAYLKASNTGAGDGFGHSVALSDDTVAVGAWAEDSAAQGVGGHQDDDSAPESGAVYVFRRTGTTWQQEAYLKASNTGADDRFGYSVALSGDTVAVGASREDSAAKGVGGNQDDDSAPESGAVYVFRRTGTDWQQAAYVKASDTAAHGYFMTVALTDDTLAVGALGTYVVYMFH
jgi:hypothetical protein